MAAITFLSFSTFAQEGLPLFQQLPGEEQHRIIQRIHPWPSDEGRANVVYGTFTSPRRLDGMAQRVSQVDVIMADLNLSKTQWAYEDEVEVENQATVRPYLFNEGKQLAEYLNFQPVRLP